MVLSQIISFRLSKATKGKFKMYLGHFGLNFNALKVENYDMICFDKIKLIEIVSAYTLFYKHIVGS